jgi:Lon protease-like protein
MEKEQRLRFPNRSGLMILPWVTLFPGGLLPLRIFEERYRHMLRDALAKHRMFAIAHVDESIEEKSGIDWDGLGTLGVLRACVTNEDGTSNLILQGVARVEFSNHSHTPYPRADIEILRDPGKTSEAIEQLRASIMARIQNPPEGANALPQGFAEHLATIESPASFADIVASTLVAHPLHRRQLLEELEVTNRLELLQDYLFTSDEDWAPEPENFEAETGED